MTRIVKRKRKCKLQNNDNLEYELEQLERNSQNILDDKIIAVCGTLLGLSVGFINTIKPTIQAHLINQVLFLLVIMLLSTTIIYSVFSHYYSACCFRKYNEQQHYSLNSNFNIEKATTRILQLNLIQTYAFISTVVCIVLLLLFFTSNNISIWQIKATFLILLGINALVFYYILNNVLQNNWLSFFINLLLFSKGVLPICLMKINNPIIQALLN